MRSDWFSGCLTKEDKAERKELLKSCLPAFNVLKSVLEKKAKDISSKCDSVSAYSETPNWALLQADKIGTVRTINDVVQLINSISDQEER